MDNSTRVLVCLDSHDAPKQVAWSSSKKALTEFLKAQLPPQSYIKSIKNKKKKNKSGRPKHRLIVTKQMGMPGLSCRWIIIKLSKWESSQERQGAEWLH